MEKFFSKNIAFVSGIIGSLIAAIVCLLHNYSYAHLPEAYEYVVVASIMLLSVVGIFIGRSFEKLQKAAMVDDLTQLWNKRYFNIRLAEELERRRRKGTPLCLAYVDIDDFKTINDKYGHVAGDSVLINMADIFKRNTRNLDIVARWGGDEFVVIFPDTTPRYGLIITNRFKKAVSASRECCQATISVGFVDINEDWDVDDVLQEVDVLLQKAKKIKDSVVASEFG